MRQFTAADQRIDRAGAAAPMGCQRGDIGYLAHDALRLHDLAPRIRRGRAFKHRQHRWHLTAEIRLLNLRPHPLAPRVASREHDVRHKFILEYGYPGFDGLKLCLYYQGEGTPALPNGLFVKPG